MVILENDKSLNCSYSVLLRWPVPIYMRVGYVFDSRFSD